MTRPEPAALRVLVVDDSAVVRQTLRMLLSRDPSIEVAVASDPLIAMQKIREVRPDVIVLDLAMPRMDGLTFLRQLMERDPIPVVVCSAATGPGTEPAFQALEEGAVEVIAKPSIGVREFLAEAADSLILTLRAAAAATPERRPRALTTPLVGKPLQVRRKRPSLVAIGVSTGGPSALRTLLAPLPADSPPLLIVQHMPTGFTASLAARLDSISQLEVREARDGDEPRSGVALLAPSDTQMMITRSGAKFRIVLTGGPRVSGHRPSIDVLFDSIARAAGAHVLGILLTGMGRDGAAGLLAMKQAGAATIAQSEESCVVFGMPKQAIALGAVDRVLPIEAIAPAIVEGIPAQRTPPKGEDRWNDIAS